MPPLYEDTGPPLQVCGYASVFNVDCAIGDGRLERVKAGAFNLTGPIFATFLHDGGPAYARTQDRTLQVWQDAYGLAFAFKLPSSWNGVALARSISAGTFRSCSVKFATRTVEQRVEHGHTVELVTAATIDELSIHPSGSNPMACTWTSLERVEDLPPFVASARARWHVGKQGQHLAAHRVKPQARGKPSLSVPASVDRCLALAARIRR